MATGSFLEPYRVLDLTDEKGFLCGRLLGDLGADVIKIEPPGGDPSRMRSPYWGDQPHPENSLYWYAFNASKRGVTLDLENAGGRDLFRQLVLTADLLLESFPPDYLDRLGLGYGDLSKIRPQLVMTSITPFGQTGPYRQYKGTDLTLMALGGVCKSTGDGDRPPLRLCLDQSYAMGCLYAAAASLMALWYGQQAGRGQHVDVSLLEGLLYYSLRDVVLWDFHRKLTAMSGNRFVRVTGDFQFIWSCKDGCLVWLVFGGATGARENRALLEWMAESGMGGELAGLRDLNLATIDTGSVREWERVIQSFFLTKTKKELREEGARRGISVAPISAIDEVLSDEHLRQRGFWSEIHHGDRNRSVVYPGRFFFSNECECVVRGPAPLVGEHNEDVLGEARRRQAERPMPSTAPVPFTKPDTGAGGPLAGIKVLDLTWWMAGPRTTQILGDHGAEVIKVESMARLDLYRQSEPFAGRPSADTGALFITTNTSKRSVTLNLGLPIGRELVRRLVRWADIVVQNFRPGTMERLGLDYDALAKIKPEIIMVSLSCLGQTGSRAAPGNAHVSGALSGHYYMTGWPDRGPTHVLSAGLSDVVQPLGGVIAIIAALEYRRRTGKGQHIDLAQLDLMVQLVAPAVLDLVVNGRVMGRDGNRHPDASPHGLFRCKGEDQWCAVAVFTDEEWLALCRAMGRPRLAEDPRFISLSRRKQNEDQLEEIVEQWTASRPAREVMDTLQRVGVAAGVAQDARDIVEYDPQVKARGSFLQLEHPAIGVCRHPTPPFKLSMTPARVRTSPCIGQDSQYVFKEILGLSDDEISDLLAFEAAAEFVPDASG